MKKTTALISLFRTISALVLLVITPVPRSAGGQATFRVVAYMNQYDQPQGILEGSPGVFYSQSGSATTVVLSITAQGVKTILASFKIGYSLPSLLVSGANGRFYSTAQFNSNSPSVVSVASNPGSKLFYAPLSMDPIMTQNLPDGTLLGFAQNLSHTLVMFSVSRPRVSLRSYVTFQRIHSLATTPIRLSRGATAISTGPRQPVEPTASERFTS
jgi:hypothetical protein